MTDKSDTPVADELEQHGSRYYNNPRWHKKVFTKLRNLERTIAELVGALEQIVEAHSMYCENHVNVSNHSYELAGIAEAALARTKAQP